MTDSENVVGFVFLFFIGFLCFSWYDQHKYIKLLEAKIGDCQTSIVEANRTIGTMQTNIDLARLAAWDDYYSMGFALEDLEDGDMIEDNCEIPEK